MTNEIKPSVTFVSILRRSTVPANTQFQYFCDMDNRETTWALVAEDARCEYYRCQSCGKEKGWPVR